jgi:hypothetical protein
LGDCERVGLSLVVQIVTDLKNELNILIVMNTELVNRLNEFIEIESRSGSMEPALITPEYVFRMWGGKVELSEIEEAMKELKK